MNSVDGVGKGGVERDGEGWAEMGSGKNKKEKERKRKKKKEKERKTPIGEGAQVKRGATSPRKVERNKKTRKAQEASLRRAGIDSGSVSSSRSSDVERTKM